MEARWGGKVDIMMMTLNVEQVSNKINFLCMIINCCGYTSLIKQKFKTPSFSKIVFILYSSVGQCLQECLSESSLCSAF